MKDNAPPPTTADPMTSERLAEIRERATRITGYGGARAAHVLAAEDVPALLAEVARLRAEERIFVGVINERDQALRERNEARTERDDARADADRYLAKTVEATDIIGRLQGEVAGMKERLGTETVKRTRAERERDAVARAAEANVARLDQEVEDYEATVKDLAGQVKDLTEQVKRVREWADSDVVTAGNEFGNGYREALRDVRDLLSGEEPGPEVTS